MKTAMKELIELIPDAYEIKKFISENDADEKMLDEFLFERIFKNKNWIEKEKEQIKEAYIEGYCATYITVDSEQYYNDKFKN